MRRNGFDEVDLEALFVAVAKKSKADDHAERLSSPQPDDVNKYRQ
jgi:hypothetical protein